jgi:hypothetical protein
MSREALAPDAHTCPPRGRGLLGDGPYRPTIGPERNATAIQIALSLHIDHLLSWRNDDAPAVTEWR